jgi:hypothetical protein
MGALPIPYDVQYPLLNLVQTRLQVLLLRGVNTEAQASQRGDGYEPVGSWGSASAGEPGLSCTMLTFEFFKILSLFTHGEVRMFGLF